MVAKNDTGPLLAASVARRGSFVKALTLDFKPRTGARKTAEEGLACASAAVIFWPCFRTVMTFPVKPKRHILVVDDEPMVCDAVEMMLRHDGHSVQTANNAAEALDCMDRAEFDLVITDYAMPHMKGDELARRIKLRNPEMPIVLITAHAEVLQSTGTPLPGIALVISKPFMLETLRDAIRLTCPVPA